MNYNSHEAPARLRALTNQAGRGERGGQWETEAGGGWRFEFEGGRGRCGRCGVVLEVRRDRPSGLGRCREGASGAAPRGAAPSRRSLPAGRGEGGGVGRARGARGGMEVGAEAPCSQCFSP